MLDHVELVVSPLPRRTILLRALLLLTTSQPPTRRTFLPASNRPLHQSLLLLRLDLRGTRPRQPVDQLRSQFRMIRLAREDLGGSYLRAELLLLTTVGWVKR